MCLLTLDLENGKLWDARKEDGHMFHKLHVPGTNGDLWDRDEEMTYGLNPVGAIGGVGSSILD